MPGGSKTATEWNIMIDCLKRLTVVASPGIKVDQTTRGTVIKVEPTETTGTTGDDNLVWL